MGQPEVAVSTLVMAGSLVQTPSVAAAPPAQGELGDIGPLQRSRRFRIVAGILLVVCRLIVVSRCPFSSTEEGCLCHSRYPRVFFDTCCWRRYHVRILETKTA